MSIPPSSVSCWLLLFLSWPAAHFYAQFSFRHAPVSKGVFFASAAATFACFSSKVAADFVDVRRFELTVFIRFLRLTIAQSDEIVVYYPRSGCEARDTVSDFSWRERRAVRPLHAVLVPMLRAHDGAAQVQTTSQAFKQNRFIICCKKHLHHPGPLTPLAPQVFFLGRNVSSPVRKSAGRGVGMFRRQVICLLLPFTPPPHFVVTQNCRLPSGPYSLLYFGLVLYYRFACARILPHHALSHSVFCREIPASLNFSMLGFRYRPPQPPPKFHPRAP
jgi:hypothetical protein